ncbi:MAG: HAD-IIB family hydrolase [Proteobacteria bacterium]|nr:HAD-IIB family hydrolase [Pseudomonadota bacterium]
MKPISEFPSTALRGVRAVLSDIDDTLTLHGRLPGGAYQALQDLRRAGVIIIPVTGRPAGWCDLIARQWPADAVVGENGAFYFAYDDKAKRMDRVYTQDKATREANSKKLWRIADRVLADFPGTAIASDQAYREIDVAIDFCEDVPPLPLQTAQAIADAFHKEGATAKVSSIHVNAWFGAHDKLSMARKLLQERFGLDVETQKSAVVYCGDSPNDSPMFAGFPLGVGVANVKALAHLMPSLPAYVTEQDGGDGFVEFAKLLLAAKA